MTKTTLQNSTTSIIVLKEGQAGILRKLCEIQPGDHYNVHSELNQTYREYWCVSNNSNQFTLSSDDLSDWKAIVIKPTPTDSKKFYWEGTSPRGQKNAKKDDPNTPGTPPAHSSSWSKFLPNKVVGWLHKQKPSGTTPPATATLTPSTAP